MFDPHGSVGHPVLLIECPLEHLKHAQSKLRITHLSVVQRRAELFNDLEVQLPLSCLNMS